MNFFVVLPCLWFYDVDEEYLDGILYEMVPRYAREYSAEIPGVFKYSSDTDYEKTHASLSTKCKEMKL